MTYSDLTKTGLNIEREEQDRSGRKFCILGKENCDLVVIVRENRPHDNDFFMIDLYRRKEANKELEKFISNR